MSVGAKRLDGSRCMPLGMKVGLCPGHIVLDGDPAPPKVAQPPIFVPYLLSTCYISPFYVIRFREIRLRVDLAKNIVAAGR